jgi:uncharacterized repeat protein (TIGR01451 family)
MFSHCGKKSLIDYSSITLNPQTQFRLKAFSAVKNLLANGLFLHGLVFGRSVGIEVKNEYLAEQLSVVRQNICVSAREDYEQSAILPYLNNVVNNFGSNRPCRKKTERRTRKQVANRWSRNKMNRSGKRPALVVITNSLGNSQFRRADCEKAGIVIPMKTRWMAYLILGLMAVARTNSAAGTADLGLKASVPFVSSYSFGFNIVYTVAVTNMGPAQATGVVVSNQLPANVTFVSASDGVSPVNGILLFNLGTLAAGGSNSVQIIVQPNLEFPALSESQSEGQPMGQLTNVFRVFANETDPVPTNNSATVVAPITDAYPGTPLAWHNPGGQTTITYSILFSGAPRPIYVGGNDRATNGQPGDIVLLIDPNGGTNIANWAAVARFFNPNDPTGTNSLAATNSQAFFASDFGSTGFANFRLLPEVAYLPEGTATTNNGFITIATQYDEFGPADGIFTGQLNADLLNINVALAITHTTNAAIVSWSPAVTGWALQTNTDLAIGLWGDYLGDPGNNRVTNSVLNGNLFFRLKHF